MRAMLCKRAIRVSVFILLCSILSSAFHMVHAEEAVLNPENVAVLFTAQPACYLYTGKQIVPDFVLALPDGTAIPKQSYQTKIISTDTSDTSAGTKIGRVTMTVSPTSAAASFEPVQATYQIVLRGDCNLDGVFNTVDVATLQAWLMGRGTLACWQAADASGNGIVDAVDLTVHKRQLLREAAEADLSGRIHMTKQSERAVSNAFKSKLATALLAQNPTFPFSEFTFEAVSIAQIPKDETDYVHPIGTTFFLQLYYQGLLLNPSDYTLQAHQYNDGRFVLEAKFCTAQSLQPLATLDSTKLIATEQAVAAAKAYAVDLPIPKESAGGYDLGVFKPSQSFGELTDQMIVSLSDARLVYRVFDVDYDFEIVHDATDHFFSAALQVWVDAHTAQVVDHLIQVEMGIT